APPLPAPYDYSDISTGIIGLLLGADPGQPLADSALRGWLALVQQRITTPLGMKDTLLFPPETSADQQLRLAQGYSQALATATVGRGGKVEAIRVASQGQNYAGAPLVSIRGGGGTGATATAHIGDQSVMKIDVMHGGQDYVAPPEISFSGGGDAKAQAIV